MDEEEDTKLPEENQEVDPSITLCHKIFLLSNPDLCDDVNALGEEVKAIVQVMPDVEADDALTEELLAFCREHLSRQKVPRSIDFDPALPRLPTGKLYKRKLRDRYWGEGQSRILG